MNQCFWYSQMEVLDFVFWFRQLLGFSIGLVAGLLHLTGMYVIIGFWAAMFILSNLYTSKVLNVSEEDFSNAELTMEGMPNSFGIFLVSLKTKYPNTSNALSFFLNSLHGSFATHSCENWKRRRPC